MFYFTKSVWDLITHPVVRNVITDKRNSVLLPIIKLLPRENYVFILISKIIKSYNLACQYSNKIPNLIECYNKTKVLLRK